MLYCARDIIMFIHEATSTNLTFRAMNIVIIGFPPQNHIISARKKKPKIILLTKNNVHVYSKRCLCPGLVLGHLLCNTAYEDTSWARRYESGIHMHGSEVR